MARVLRRRGESGFTLVEVMIAVLLLTIGVLGAISLVDGANRTTTVTRAREYATNLASSVLEAARAVPYTTLTKSAGATALIGQPGLPADADTLTPGWQVKRGKKLYTVAFDTCVVDDPRDGTGDDGSDYCQTATASSPADDQPADYKRVAVAVSWRDPSGVHTLRQADIVSGSYRGPSVTDLTTATGSPFTFSGGPSTISFHATTTAGTNNVKWTLDGNAQGVATGSGTSWDFTWNLGTPTGSAPCDPNGGGTPDGTYIVGADAYDTQGLSENGRALTMQLNRCPPLQVTGFQGGDNFLWPGAEFQWDASGEEDVIGYYMYTAPFTTNGPGPWSPVPFGQNPDSSQSDCGGQSATDSLVTDTTCVTKDVNGQKQYFGVRAVDRAPDGTRRVGDMSAPILVDPSNSVPGKPGPGVDGAFPYSLKWGGKAYSDPPPNDYTDFYYVYRDTKNGRPDRYDSVDNPQAGGTVYWTDPDPGTGSHTYWVTAVDNHLAESQLAPGNGITLP